METTQHYLAKCLAAAMSARFLGNNIETEMRKYRNQEPGEIYLAIASLLTDALLSEEAQAVAALKKALKGHPRKGNE
jgi:hypothetical protein